jgi:hypothetical protein
MYPTERRWGAFTTIIAVAAGLVIGGVALSLALSVLGFLAGIVWFIIRLAVLVGLAAGVVYLARLFFRDRSTV